MTHVLIDRALAEATLRELNLAAVTYAALGKVILKDGAEAMRDKLSAALANAEPTGWQKIETAPATANNVLAFSESGNMKIETGFWLINMLHAANIDGEKCNYTHWMPLPAAPGETP